MQQLPLAARSLFAGSLLRTGLWIVTVYAALTIAALLATNVYGELVLPFYGWELGWIAPNYEIKTLEVDRWGTQPVFKVVVEDRELGFIDGRLRPVGGMECQVLVMHGLQHVVLLLLVPLAWPGLNSKRRLLALLFALPLLLMVEFADIPWAIVGGLDSERADLTNGASSLAVTWMEILNTGGRLALGLAGGLAACGIALALGESRASQPSAGISPSRFRHRKRRTRR